LIRPPEQILQIKVSPDEVRISRRHNRRLDCRAHPPIGTTMKDPAELTKRANELKERAEHEQDQHVRERLLRMSGYYIEIAEHETWLISHPTSISSIGDVLTKK